MLQLLLIRHGESLGNRVGKMQGQLDYPLSLQGRSQALALGKRLAQAPRPSHCYTSPLVRAVETGHLAYSCFGDVGFGDVDGEDSGQTMPLWCVDDRLQEINNGILSGLTWPEAQQRHSKLCQALEQSADWLAIPGAESPVQCQARARSFIEELQGCHGNGDRIWVISHGGILPYLVAALVGSDRTWGFQSQPTAIFEFVWDADRWRQLEQSAHRPNSPQNSQHNYQQNRFNTTLWQIRQFNDFSHNQ